MDARERCIETAAKALARDEAVYHGAAHIAWACPEDVAKAALDALLASPADLIEAMNAEIVGVAERNESGYGDNAWIVSPPGDLTASDDYLPVFVFPTEESA